MSSIPNPSHQILAPETPAKTTPFCAATLAASSAEPALLVGAAAVESSSALLGTDAGASAWLGSRFRSVSRWVKSGGSDAGFFDLRLADALTLGLFGGGTDEEDGDGDGRFSAAE